MAEVRSNPKMTGLVIIDPVNDFLSEGGKAYPLVKPELQPKPGEVIILPHKNIDVFATTDLDTQLR